MTKLHQSLTLVFVYYILHPSSRPRPCTDIDSLVAFCTRRKLLRIEKLTDTSPATSLCLALALSRFKMERTYIMIKPDGVQRGLIGEIVKRFEQKGYKLVAMKLWSPPREFMEKHYADLSSKGFFAGLINYMVSGPVVSMVWEGANVVLEGRKMLGATKPSDSAMGTIRGDFCVEVGRNICHGSDSVESANAEIALWFPEGISEWESCEATWIYE